MERVLNAPVSAPKEWNRLNEIAFRNYMEAELADTYRKSTDIIIPVGMKLGFNGTGGEQVVLSYDSGAFSIIIDGLTVVELADDASLTALTAAYQAADAVVQASVVTEASTRASADTAIASSVTTLTATVAGNTSSISTNATAIATVDGKLSASYGLTVDVNGRIASMKLLSNGTTSSVKFTASTFQVYNGSTDEAPFEVVGGVVKIKTANVGVLVAANIDTGAVTASKISVSSLDAVSATIGLLRTATSGARMELESNVIRAYDSSGTLRVRLGVWT